MIKFQRSGNYCVSVVIPRLDRLKCCPALWCRLLVSEGHFDSEMIFSLYMYIVFLLHKVIKHKLLAKVIKNIVNQSLIQKHYLMTINKEMCLIVEYANDLDRLTIKLNWWWHFRWLIESGVSLFTHICNDIRLRMETKFPTLFLWS